MFTLTLPHRVGMSLDVLYEVVGKGWRGVIGGRPWKRMKESFGIEGYIKSQETTVGLNGWHPHLHVLLFLKRPLLQEEREQLESVLFNSWANHVERNGLAFPKRSLFYLEPVEDAEAASRYLAKCDEDNLRKMGLEMARHDLKGGQVNESRSREQRTPFQILSDFFEYGDSKDLALWHEYEQAAKGKHSISWSRGLKKALGIGACEDLELVESEEGGAVIAEVVGGDWKLVCSVFGAPVRLLELAEAGGG